MSKTVMVGCKIPTGLLLQLRSPEDNHVVLAEKAIQGCAVDMQPYVREDAIGLTEVDAEFWEAWSLWAQANKYAPYTKGFIFAAVKAADVRAEAKDRLKEKTGLEALNQDDLASAGLSKVE
jgi:hypothetical protein